MCVSMCGYTINVWVPNSGDNLQNGADEPSRMFWYSDVKLMSQQVLWGLYRNYSRRWKATQSFIVCEFIHQLGKFLFNGL